MDLVSLLAALGKLEIVTWRQREGREFVRVASRTEAGLLLESQQPDGSWHPTEKCWDPKEFLKTFEPVR